MIGSGMVSMGNKLQRLFGRTGNLRIGMDAWE